jgi:hypothetical protein
MNFRRARGFAPMMRLLVLLAAATLPLASTPVAAIDYSGYGRSAALDAAMWRNAERVRGRPLTRAQRLAAHRASRCQSLARARTANGRRTYRELCRR